MTFLKTVKITGVFVISSKYNIIALGVPACMHFGTLACSFRRYIETAMSVRAGESAVTAAQSYVFK